LGISFPARCRANSSFHGEGPAEETAKYAEYANGSLALALITLNAFKVLNFEFLVLSWGAGNKG
jgi:hypothetical protein